MQSIRGWKVDDALIATGEADEAHVGMRDTAAQAAAADVVVADCDRLSGLHVDRAVGSVCVRRCVSAQ